MKRTKTLAFVIGGLTVWAGGSAASAGPVQTFTDLDQFLAAAGDVREIDFETLPDGSASYYGAQITPEFNYTKEGVNFSAQVPPLRITGNPIGGFDLCAGPPGSEGPPNWIVADLVEPATAVGILFPGVTRLWVYNTRGELTGSWTWGGGGDYFLGAISPTDAIAQVVVNRGSERQYLESFYFTPVPEPATGLLLSAVALLLGLPRRASGTR
jgi:hypothetical protein